MPVGSGAALPAAASRRARRAARPRGCPGGPTPGSVQVRAHLADDDAEFVVARGGAEQSAQGR